MFADVWGRPRHETFPRIALLALAILLLGALLETVLEAGGNGQIRTLGDALWYAIVTMTSTGYGDVTPVTAAGRVVGALLMLSGLTVLSVVTATVASGLVAKRIKEERGLDTLRLKDHLFSEAGREFLRYESGGTRAVVNPPDTYEITGHDAIVGIPRGA